jgi:agmatinase
MQTLDAKENFLGLDNEFSSYSDSEIVIISAPLEKSVSYGKGTSGGPKAILEASHYVEFYDEEFDAEIAMNKGICTIEGLELDKLSHQEALNKIESVTSSLLDDNKFVVTLGGEHSLSIAPITSYLKKFSNLSILQIDAHSDLRDSYEGSELSHASVMKRVYEKTKNIVQVGIRAQCKEEADLIKNDNISTFYAYSINNNAYGKNWQNEVLNKLTDNVYITFDVDGLDPSIIPSTGTPEPGGLLWYETMSLLKLVGEHKNIVGFDLVELIPDPNNKYSDFVAAKLVYKMINYSFQNR